jgi:hypothetical protein
MDRITLLTAALKLVEVQETVVDNEEVWHRLEDLVKHVLEQAEHANGF